MCTLQKLMSVMDKVNKMDTKEEFYRDLDREEIEALTEATKDQLIRNFSDADIASYRNHEGQPIPGDCAEEQRASLRQMTNDALKHAFGFTKSSVTPSLVEKMKPGTVGALLDLTEHLTASAQY